MSKKYRHGVGAMILNHDNQVFVAKRMDMASGLQMPQGGLEKNENLSTALYRELEEEIGTKKFKILQQLPFSLYYDFPSYLAHEIYRGEYIGQKIDWFLMKFEGTDADINLNTKHREFAEWRWSDHTNLVNDVVYFKKTMYQIVKASFKSFFQDE